MIAMVVVAVVAIIVVLQNTETVETEILFFTLKLPRAVLLLSTLVIGFLLGLLTASRFFGKKKSD